MIIDKISNSGLYMNLNPRIKKAFEYINKTNFDQMELGKHLIEGETIFCKLMEYETKDIKDCNLEAHRKYIDIQYMISGRELIGITTLASQVATTDYDEKDDYTFYKGSSYLVPLESGQFTIFFPEDVHMPAIKIDSPSKLRKAVIKVLI